MVLKQMCCKIIKGCFMFFIYAVAVFVIKLR